MTRFFKRFYQLTSSFKINNTNAITPKKTVTYLVHANNFVVFNHADNDNSPLEQTSYDSRTAFN